MGVSGVLIGGALYALALPPIDWAFCGWVALVPLLLVLRGQSVASAFLYGCLFGYASGWGTLWSLAGAGAHYFEMPITVAVAAAAIWFLTVVGIPFGLFAAGARIVFGRFGFERSLVIVPALWVASELLRGRLIGQPWGLLGYTQHTQLALVQLASWTGVYGVSFLVVAVNVALAGVVDHVVAGRSARRALRIIVVPALLVVLCWVGGTETLRASRLTLSPNASPNAHRSKQVAVVQTNVSPVLNWTAAYTGSQIGAHLRATDAIPSAASPALIVWPENAVPRYLEAEPTLAAVLGESARRHRADLLFGAPRYESRRTFNSVRLITAEGRNGGFYDKRRLVPFAEQTTLRFRAPGASDRDSPEFGVGTQPGVLQSFVRLGVSICHEILQPDLITDSVRRGAELLVNVANDSWIDSTSDAAGLQHLAMATFRAIETRRYLVRAAITGPSAIVDPFGRVIESLPQGQRGVLTGTVAGLDTMTWYVRLGDAFAYACVVVALAGLVLGFPARPRVRRLGTFAS